MKPRKSDGFPKPASDVIGSYVVFLDAATLRGGRQYKMRREREALSAKDSLRAVAAPLLLSPPPPPIDAENNSRPESQEPVGERRPRSSQSRLRRYTHSSLSLNEKGAEHNNQCLGGGGGRKRNTLINTEDIMILGEICPSCSSQRFKTLFFFWQKHQRQARLLFYLRFLFTTAWIRSANWNFIRTFSFWTVAAQGG